MTAGPRTPPRPGSVGLAPAGADRARRRWRSPVVVAALLAAVAGAGVVALVAGDLPVSLSDVGWTLVGRGSAATELAVLDIRLPRILVAVAAGFAFGVAGAIFQAVLGNPLASPDVVGVTAGASAAALTCLLVVGSAGPALSFSAVAGGLVTAVVVGLLARGGAAPRLVLIGVGVAAALLAVVSFLLTGSGVTVAAEGLVWLTGSLAARSWEHAVPLLVGVLLLVGPTLVVAWRLRVLVLGDDLAAALGEQAARVRPVLLLLAATLASLATAAAGPVQFVALLAAPVARRLRRDGQAAPVTSGLVGALLVTVADLLGQHATPVAVPAGVLTGLLGGPYLLWTLGHR